MWYLVCVLIGLILGYVIKDLISPELVIKGKVKQKGEGNSLSLKNRLNLAKNRRSKRNNNK